MNALCDFLEDFGEFQPRSDPSLPVMDEGEIEANRLAAFEEGYRAGWDDADKARAGEAGQVSAALNQKLQDLAFTYQEAYGNVMTAMTPLLEDVVNRLLPDLAQATIGAHVLETLQGMARDIGQVEVELAVAPSNVDAVAPLIEGGFAFPLRVVPDDSLRPDQAGLRFAQTEKEIDLGDLVQTVREAVQGFAHDNKRTLANG